MNAPSPRFDAREKLLPAPASLFGSLLAEIGDAAEMKCTLRVVGLAAQMSGVPKRVAASRLETDAVLLEALGSPEEVRRGVRLAVERGTLLEASGWLLLRTPQNEREAEALGLAPQYHSEEPATRPSVYELYEQNIGMLTPLIAEALRDAEKEYPAQWVESAIEEAAARNARSWRYISAVLEHWKSENRGPTGTRGSKRRGEPGRHSETLTVAEYLERQRRP